MDIWQILIPSIFNLTCTVIATAFAYHRSRQETEDRVEAERRRAERSLIDMMATSATQFGETVAAVRQKISDVELWNRDNFVHKTTFQSLVNEQRSNWQRLEDKLDQRFDKIEAKIDKLEEAK